jgi:hypothetical protein
MIHGMGMSTRLMAWSSPAFSGMLPNPVLGAGGAPTGVEPLTLFESFIHMNLNAGTSQLSLRNLYPETIHSSTRSPLLSPIDTKQMRIMSLALDAATCGEEQCSPGSTEPTLATGAFFYDREHVTTPIRLFTGLGSTRAGQRMPIADFSGSHLNHFALQDAINVAPNGDLVQGTEYLMSYTQIPGGESQILLLPLAGILCLTQFVSPLPL